MKKAIAVFSILATIICLFGCNNNKDKTYDSSKLESSYTETDGNATKTDDSSSEDNQNQSSVDPSSDSNSKGNKKTIQLMEIYRVTLMVIHRVISQKKKLKSTV